jgi:hypothetical protein
MHRLMDAILIGKPVYRGYHMSYNGNVTCAFATEAFPLPHTCIWSSGTAAYWDFSSYDEAHATVRQYFLRKGVPGELLDKLEGK